MLLDYLLSSGYGFKYTYLITNNWSDRTSFLPKKPIIIYYLHILLTALPGPDFFLQPADQFINAPCAQIALALLPY